jgi:hypothetical protein
MSDVLVRKSNRGRKNTLTDSTRKLHKQDNSAKYNKTRICIGAEYDRWTELKDVLPIKTHAEVAKILPNWEVHLACDFFCFGLKLLT